MIGTHWLMVNVVPTSRRSALLWLKKLLFCHLKPSFDLDDIEIFLSQRHAILTKTLHPENSLKTVVCFPFIELGFDLISVFYEHIFCQSGCREMWFLNKVGLKIKKSLR